MTKHTHKGICSARGSCAEVVGTENRERCHNIVSGARSIQLDHSASTRACTRSHNARVQPLDISNLSCPVFSRINCCLYHSTVEHAKRRTPLDATLCTPLIPSTCSSPKRHPKPVDEPPSECISTVCFTSWYHKRASSCECWIDTFVGGNRDVIWRWWDE
jgi:hypothetical protein